MRPQPFPWLGPFLLAGAVLIRAIICLLTGARAAWHILLRQGGTYALIGVVSIIMIAGVFVRNAVANTTDWTIHDPSGDRIGMAKIHEPFLPKSIQVFHASPNKPIFIVAGKGGVKGVRSPSEYSINGDEAEIFRQIVVAEGRWFPCAAFSGKCFNNPSEISSWQSPDIFKANVSNQMRCCRGANALRHSLDIGALEDSSIVRLGLSGVFGGLPEIAGGPPKRNGGAGENDCEKRDNLFVVFVQKMTDPSKESPDISDERAAKGGAVFFGGIILAGIVAYLIAGRKQ